MSVRRLAPALFLTLALALAGQPVQAQGASRGGGGSRGSGGGSAVARHPSGGARPAPAGGAHYGSGSGYAPRGGVAERRHPGAGTGSGSYYYGGHYRPYYGGYYGSHYYRPYYGGYYGYSYPWFSLSFGWPYYSTWPYYSGYYSNPGYAVGYYAPAPAAGGYDNPPSDSGVAEANRSPGPGRESGRVRLEVRPEDTSVYVDDAFRGTAREARALTLPPGRHTIELVRPGYATELREVDVVTGESRDVLVEMQRR
jgi:hypothetical protein